MNSLLNKTATNVLAATLGAFLIFGAAACDGSSVTGIQPRPGGDGRFTVVNPPNNGVASGTQRVEKAS